MTDRGNYEDRHPNDLVLHPLTEIREWDEALAELGIQDSDQTPAYAIRELKAEIERLRLDLCFCREAMRHADIDLSMILPDVGPDMQKEFRKTLARLDEAKVRSLSNGDRQ